MHPYACSFLIDNFSKDLQTLKSDTENITLMSLSGVKRFPMRVKCATLAWHTLIEAVEENKKIVNTEN